MKRALLALWSLATPVVTFAATTVSPVGDGLSLGSVSVSVKGDGSIADYLGAAYKVGVVAVAALAVLVIAWGAVEVMGESFYKKADGRQRIWNAVLGLLLALGSVVILQTISTSLLSVNLSSLSSLGDAVDSRVASQQAVSLKEGLTTSNNRPSTETSGTGSTSGTGNSNENWTTGSGSIAKNTLSGVTFPDDSWDSYALEQIRSSGIMDLNPSDASKYFPNGIVTEQGYVSLLASIAKSESNFNAKDNIDHAQGTDVGSTYSVGLFSLSGGDAIVKNLGYTEQDLGDPYKSITAATLILKNQISKSGSIAGGTGTGSTGHYWGPLYRNE